MITLPEATYKALYQCFIRASVVCDIWDMDARHPELDQAIMDLRQEVERVEAIRQAAIESSIAREVG